MAGAEIIQLGGLDDTDKAFEAFIDSLKEDASRAVFIIERKDGTVAVGTNSTDRRDIVYDIFRLQQLCINMVNNTSEIDEEYE